MFYKRHLPGIPPSTESESPKSKVQCLHGQGAFGERSVQDGRNGSGG